MIQTVLDTESDLMLLTPEEISVLLAFQRLSANAQDLFVFLLIHPTWHRLPSLRLVEIPWGDLSCTISELARPLELAVAEFDCEDEVKPELASVKTEETPIDISSLPLPTKQEPLQHELPCKPEPVLDTIPGPSDADVKSEDVDTAAGPSALFPSHKPAPLPSSLCITDAGMTLRQLLEYMGPDEQRVIGKDLKIKPGKKKTDLIESILTFSSGQRTLEGYFGKGKAKAGTEKGNSQEARLRAMIMKKLEKLVRVNEEVFEIFRRVHIIYFRSTQFPIEIIPRPLRHLQRSYPEYIPTRRAEIWPHRAMLLEYEDALKADAVFDGVLPSPVAQDAQSPKGKLKGKTRAVDEEDDDAKAKERKAAALRKARATKTLFDEVFCRWSAHLGIKKQSAAAPTGLDRLEPGYALTRVLHKGVKALKALKKRRAEADVYEVLLDQRFWCSGLRGAWHIRKTAIHASRIKAHSGEGKNAIDASSGGIRDPATRLVYRHTLIKNLVRLQKRLQVPEDEQVSIPEASKVGKVVIEAVRVKTKDPKKNCNLWLTQDDEAVPIDTLVWQHYKEAGFPSISAGSCFFTTLFTLLFWDIIFMPVDGAFDTRFQTGPLDLCADTFRPSRASAINQRVSEIEAGGAAHYLKKHDAQYRPARPCAVGVRWDLCATQDLVGIVECVPPGPLALMCRMFCEDYAGACMGAPDLVAWDADASGGAEYKFVHIKGPGYPSRANQKAWRDVLARGGAEQEVCEVVERGKRKGKGKKKGEVDSDSEEDSGSEAEQEEDEEDELAESQDSQTQSQASASGSKKRARDSDDEDAYQPTRKRKKTGS
ncbi:hypothetical protein B0H15DRAFT_486580 [Mycena belliarum]|uniref:Fanconi-associated nuclease n=1 Tax=Mycena belliarum TaxID=1033014 RepID=A0AAD6TV18_9AGAR|nr:hypothetical protein B0H15DRAFT_486580 [Mycena belliae]